MRIIQITPGTGTFYCGNCVRDNALVRALRAQGHDAVMLPLYLPIMVEDESVAADAPIFFGGVNVYLQQISSIFRYTPRWIDRWFDSKSLLTAASKKAGMTKAEDLGELTLSTLKGEEGNQKKEVLRLVEWLKEDPRPDVICLSNGLLAGLARTIKNEVGCAVFCTLQGEDGFLDSLRPPFNEQCWQALRDCEAYIDGYIPVSHYYGELMRGRLQLPDDKVHMILNGVSLDGYREPSLPMDPLVIGYLARQCEDKGLHSLIDAFIELKQNENLQHLKLRIAGTMTPGDEHFVAEQKSKLQTAGVLDDVDFLPNISREEKIDFLHSITIFSVPAMYGEAFGLYVIEAMAAGVPVVQPNHAGFVELLEAAPGGRLYDPDDPASLKNTLQSLLLNADDLKKLGAIARESAFALFSVERMAKDVAAAYESVCMKSN
ncbi:MAG: glycosyltransferase family 4 protein [Candidatus Hinthialibacter antarcticus]|nr:glycosyltransferase family 4 protein [Candidatus Hinthialibacter antarcticus]